MNVKAKIQEAKPETLNSAALRKLLEVKVPVQHFALWIVGDSPLICHAWSEKAKREMLSKQVKATKVREAREPHEDFISSLYIIAEGQYGFPTMAIKSAVVDCAHKDKGIARTLVQNSLWLDTTFVSIGTAHRGASCDMPLTRVYGSEPRMREDMVRIGSGLNRTANLAYRATFSKWAMFVTGRFNPTSLPVETLVSLLAEAGATRGIGEWRNEKSGVFGAFHLTTDDSEDRAWSNFRDGKGPLPGGA
jgi:hypothetical protein